MSGSRPAPPLGQTPRDTFSCRQISHFCCQTCVPYPSQITHKNISFLRCFSNKVRECGIESDQERASGALLDFFYFDENFAEAHVCRPLHPLPPPPFLSIYAAILPSIYDFNPRTFPLAPRLSLPLLACLFLACLFLARRFRSRR